jgi:hypothetical protein
MSDIANELRERSLRAEQEGEPLALLDEAADEIERLRSHVELLEASSKASHSTIMLLDSAVKNMAAEIERLRLTDAEREAIVTALAFLREEADEPGVAQDADTLRGLLERTK